MIDGSTAFLVALAGAVVALIAVIALSLSARRALKAELSSVKKERDEAVASLLGRRRELERVIEKLGRYEAIEPEPRTYESRIDAAASHLRSLKVQFESDIEERRAKHAEDVAAARREVERMAEWKQEQIAHLERLREASSETARAEIETLRVELRMLQELKQANLESLRRETMAAEDQHKSRVLEAERHLTGLQVAIATADALLEEREPVVYPRQYPLESSEQLKARLKDIQARQKEIRRKGQVVTRFGPAVQEKLTAEERAKAKSLVRLARLALEAAVDSLVDKVKATNQERMEVQFQLVVADLNRTLQPWGFEIGKNYQGTVYESLDVKSEYLQQVEKEREEQRSLREQMKEEAAALREAERAQKEAEQDERRAERELAKASDAAARASAEERDRWLARVHELETALAEAHVAKERAVAMAQLTKAGHIYVISNIGAFGKDVFKVGMTRRLDPDDRIVELGDASVPFPFDVHGMIRSDDAPALEASLHRAMDEHRINRVNLRKEFFRIPFSELRRIVQEHGATIELTELAEAIEYRQTRAMIEGGTAPVKVNHVDEVGAEEPVEE